MSELDDIITEMENRAYIITGNLDAIKLTHQRLCERIDQLEVALGRYGEHTKTCAFWRTGQDCSCGLGCEMEATK